MTAAQTSVDIPALKARHPLGDVVEALGVSLRGRGRVRQGLCPFHEEREGSFTVYADSQRWYCFGCGLGGDVLDFIQRLDELSLSEAIRRLDASTGTVSATTAKRSALQRSRPPPSATRDSALLTTAMQFYAAQLRRSSEAGRYLAARGIGPEAARRLCLGFAPGSGLRDHLRALQFGQVRLQTSGLFGERGERFDGMIVVPEIAAGRVRWLGGRAIRSGAQQRFQALPGAKPLLGLRGLPTPAPWIVLTEGLFDWLVLAAWDMPACAALGTQGMEKLADALRGQPRVFLAFDSDGPGRAAAAQLVELLGPQRTAVVELPQGISDVADLGRRPQGRASFLTQLQQAARRAG